MAAILNKKRRQILAPKIVKKKSTKSKPRDGKEAVRHIVKRQLVFAAFASLYGCVLVTSAAKLLEDQEPEARIHGCMANDSHKNFGPDLLL